VKYIVRSHGREMEIDVDADGVRIDGEAVPARLAEVAGTPERVLTVGAAIHRVIVRRGVNRGDYTLWVDGYRFEVEALDERTRAIRELAAVSAGPGGPAPLKSPMPGMIVRVNVAAGDAVQVGQGLVVIEAMKMENELRATGAGTVKRVHVTAGTAVEKGALLVEME
jgi:biotin carboxyl carrier protein